MRKQTRPSTVKTQIALERATHERPTHRSSTPNYKDLLSEVFVIVVLRGHLHEVPSCARVEEVVHCSGRSCKTVKAEKENNGETIALRYNLKGKGCKCTSMYGGYSFYQNIDENQEVT